MKNCLLYPDNLIKIQLVLKESFWYRSGGGGGRGVRTKFNGRSKPLSLLLEYPRLCSVIGVAQHRTFARGSFAAQEVLAPMGSGERSKRHLPWLLWVTWVYPPSFSQRQAWPWQRRRRRRRRRRGGLRRGSLASRSCKSFFTGPRQASAK